MIDYLLIFCFDLKSVPFFKYRKLMLSFFPELTEKLTD